MHWVGPDGTILWANRAEIELLGYSAEEYIGQHIARFHVDRAAIDEMLTRLSEGKNLRDYPARLRCKDGSIRQVLIDTSVLWEEGRFIHTRCFTRDITELQLLAETRGRLGAIVESADDAIIGKTLDGIVTSWNPGAERLYGYTAAEIVGQPISRLMPPDKRTSCPRSWRDFAAASASTTMRRCACEKMASISTSRSASRPSGMAAATSWRRRPSPATSPSASDRRRRCARSGRRWKSSTSWAE